MPELVQPHLSVGTLCGRDQPRLTGAHLTLRPWHENDADALVEAYADPQIQHWHGRSVDPHEAVEQITRLREAWTAETGGSWAIVDGDDRVLGRVALVRTHLPDGVTEVAYWVAPAARRRGVATAAVATLRRWALDEIGFHRLELRHSVENLASCAVATSSGFALEGTLRQAALHDDGWHDMHLHACLR